MVTGRSLFQIAGRRLGGRVRTLEVWFDDEPESLGSADLLVFHQRSEPVSERRWLYFYTMIIDLRQSPEEILMQMNKTTAKEIRRARDKDRLSCEFIISPNQTDIHRFADMYDSNPRSRDQGPIDRIRLQELNHAGLLQISKVQTEDRTDLVWRCNLAHERQGIAQPLFAASLHHSSSDREQISLVGRANRLLHYTEMLHFREHGYKVYDFNGWYAGLEDEKRLQINRFKEGFGGKIIYKYDCEEPVSPWGRCYLLCRDIKRRLFQPDVMKEIQRRRQKAPSLSSGEIDQD